MLCKCCFPATPFKESKAVWAWVDLCFLTPFSPYAYQVWGWWVTFLFLTISNVINLLFIKMCNKFTVWLFLRPVPLQNHCFMQTSAFTHLGREHRQKVPNIQPTKPPHSHHSSSNHFSISFQDPCLELCVCTVSVQEQEILASKGLILVLVD